MSDRSGAGRSSAPSLPWRKRHRTGILHAPPQTAANPAPPGSRGFSHVIASGVRVPPPPATSRPCAAPRPLDTPSHPLAAAPAAGRARLSPASANGGGAVGRGPASCRVRRRCPGQALSLERLDAPPRLCGECGGQVERAGRAGRCARPRPPGGAAPRSRPCWRWALASPPRASQPSKRCLGLPLPARPPNTAAPPPLPPPRPRRPLPAAAGPAIFLRPHPSCAHASTQHPHPRGDHLRQQHELCGLALQHLRPGGRQGAWPRRLSANHRGKPQLNAQRAQAGGGWWRARGHQRRLTPLCVHRAWPTGMAHSTLPRWILTSRAPSIAWTMLTRTRCSAR